MKPLFKLFLVILLGIGITSFDLINHKNVYTLTDYIKELKNSKKYAIITLDNNKIDIIDMENLDKLNIFLAQQYNYPLIKY